MLSTSPPILFSDNIIDIYLKMYASKLCRLKWYICMEPRTIVSALPFETQDFLSNLPDRIHKELASRNVDLSESSRHLFDGKGKIFRPTMIMLMAGCCNYHKSGISQVSPSQSSIAMIAEMIHVASLVHDDVIDNAALRRGNPSVNSLYGEKLAVVSGDFILSRASIMLARLEDADVIKVLATVIDDLVGGEIMQLKSISSKHNDRFKNYMEKTYKKTASLMANSCRAVAMLGSLTEEICKAAFLYGRHIGLAFQLVDDVLDYQATSSHMGKPTTIDLKLGLATAPVLYAAEEFPELNDLIERRFSMENDVSKSLQLVAKSSGLSKTLKLAEKHISLATKALENLEHSLERDLLVELGQDCIKRTK